MKYTKPKPFADPRADDRAILNFLDSLPAEFEIVEPGNVQVRWPEGLTRERLEAFALQASWCSDPEPMQSLNALAAIAPVEKKEKKMMKVLVTLDFGTHKVGPFESECEVDA